jgi:general transcription factor IIIA
VIDELVGDSYAADPNRNIPCLDPNCPHRFIREYDLQVHMRAAHPEPSMLDSTLPTAGFPSLISGPLFEDGVMGNGAMTPQADIDWALDGGAFWVGVEDPVVQNQDTWSQEEEQMRKLIDPDLFGL